MRSTRTILLQTIAEVIQETAQKDHDFISDLNNILPGYVLLIKQANRNSPNYSEGDFLNLGPAPPNPV
jgi:hypothetical protein